MRGCSAIKANGKRCRGIAAETHDPVRADERSRVASEAAKSLLSTRVIVEEIPSIKARLIDLYAG